MWIKARNVRTIGCDPSTEGLQNGVESSGHGNADARTVATSIPGARSRRATWGGSFGLRCLLHNYLLVLLAGSGR
jgi:hypothetical protein